MKKIKSIILFVVLAMATTTFVFAQVDTVKTVSLKVKGLHCSDDVKTISDNVVKLKGVSSCNAGKTGATTSFTIKFDPARITENDITSAIENTPGCDNPEEKPYKVKK